MRPSTFVGLSIVIAACGGGSSSQPGDGGTGTGPGDDGGTDTGAGLDSGNSSGQDASSAGDSSSDGSKTRPGSDGGSSWSAGNPDGKCSSPIPAAGQPADVSKPTTVVGTGTAASYTLSALGAAVTKGGVVTFDCGAAPVTIAVTSTLNLPIATNTVVDGGRLVTLDGGGKTQIFDFNSGNWMNNETRVTLQHLRLVNGLVPGSSPIPPAPPPCSQGFDAGEGGAIFMRDGNLSVIDCIFETNTAAPTGPDVGGGAIRMLGSKHGVVIVSSTFTSNKASNGAAVGCLFSELDVYDSLFGTNTATGHDANNDDASKCSAMNNGQNEIGSGGNGGALYSDGASVNVTLCGDEIVNNAAGTNAFGGGLFFTSNDYGGTLTIADSIVMGNTGGHWTNVKSGSVTNAGTAVGTNAKSITITNSMIQGVP